MQSIFLFQVFDLILYVHDLSLITKSLKVLMIRFSISSLKYMSVLITRHQLGDNLH